MSQAGNLVTTGGGGGGGITSVETDLGTATPVGGVLEIVTANVVKQAGSTVLFSGSGNTVLLSVTDSILNTIVGADSGNTALVQGNNTIFGSASGVALTTAESNIFVGNDIANLLDDGDFNIIIGHSSGENYNTGAESNNILIGMGIDGVPGESNTLRIGTTTGAGTGELAQAFICGIDNVDVGSVARVVTENANQLGTADIVAGSGITVTPGANTITIAATAGGSPVAFITTVSTTINNVTGDGTNYTVVYNNVIVDTDGAYNNTTGVFTAPLNGLYQFNASVCAQGLTAAHDYEMRIDSNDAGQELEGPYLAAGLIAVGGIYNGSVSGVMNLTAGDEVFVTFISGGGAKVVDVFNVYSWFNGFRIG